MKANIKNAGELIPKAPTLIGLSFALRNLQRALWEETLERDFDARIRKPYWERFRKDGKVRCFYCLTAVPGRWDHVIPVTKGGATVKGNLVPVCGPCDDSKGDQSFVEWMEKKWPNRAENKEIGRLLEQLQREFNVPATLVTRSIDAWPTDKREIASRLHQLVTELGEIAANLKSSK